ncbi:sensor histidine kinase [Almyronema epifaneia]|uniref:histidine kinase n=1 Tax=Almyronema epifaneia S1 TaxID=2991925 RepID=A0ABW6IAS0_9CYAN
MFNLSRYFSATSLTAFAIAIAAFGVFNRQSAVANLVKIVEHNNQVLTRSFANSLWLEYGDFLTSTQSLSPKALRYSPETQKLRQAILNETQGLPVIKVKIFDQAGRVVFSTVPAQTGLDGSASAGFQAAQSGETASSFKHGSTVFADVPQLANRRLVSSYVPIRSGGTDDPVMGVLELYTDVTLPMQAVQRNQFKILLGMVGGAALLYVVLFAIVSRANRILKRQHQDLEIAKESLAAANQELEYRVVQRTAELQAANDRLQGTLSELTQTQAQLIHQEKMSSLGQLVAGVAHEVNTPLGAIRSSVGSVAKFLQQTLTRLPLLLRSLSEPEQTQLIAFLQRSLQASSLLSAREERKFRKSLTQTLQTQGVSKAETIADMLVDIGLYQETEAFLPLLLRPDSDQIVETVYKLSGIQRGIQTIEMAADRASKVIFALKTYARYDQSGETTQALVTDGIETALMLYHNQLKRGVEIERHYQAVPLIRCFEDQLNQVWTNLIHNALQAMDYSGCLCIRVEPQGEGVEVAIADSGKGIAPDIQRQIFEPFFTTKPAGEGSGLGLNIVKKIVDRHGGTIRVTSVPGQTVFTLWLPSNLALQAEVSPPAQLAV